MLIMRNSENFTGPRKTDTVTFTIGTQYFHTVFII